MKKTHIKIILDESGSMSSHREQVVNTFNEYVTSLRKGEAKKSIRLGLRKFTTHGTDRRLRMEEVFDGKKLGDVEELTMDDYMPDAMTPLLDAVGVTIRETAKQLKSTAKVLIVIHTDGQENSSTEYTYQTLAALIKEMEETRGWTFVYLGEGLQAFDQGAKFGVKNVGNFTPNRRGAVMDTLAVASTSYACDANIGGEKGATRSFYQDAGVAANHIDPKELGPGQHSDPSGDKRSADSQ